MDLEKENVEDKLGVIDLKATLNDNQIVDIEMQRQNNYDIIERTTKYSSNLIMSQLKRGDLYIKLKPVILITILDYNFLPYEEYITETKIVIKEHADYEINELQKYYYIELPKFRKKELEPGNKVMEWLALIDGEDKEKVKKAVKNNKLVEKAQEEYEYLVGDERIRRLAELEEKAASDLNAAKAAGRIDGVKEGKIAIAKIMLKENVDINFIAKVTELSVEEIQKLYKL